jgi:hypothetical protein
MIKEIGQKIPIRASKIMKPGVGFITTEAQ